MANNKNFVIKEPSKWTSFSQDPKTFLKQNKAFSDLGFKEVYVGGNVNESISREKLTLIISPADRSKREIMYADYEELKKTYTNLETTYLRTASNIPNLVISFKANTTTYFLGEYIESKNLVWIVTNIYTLTALEKNSWEFVIDTLKKAKDDLKIEQIKIDIMTELGMAYQKNITNAINNNKQQINSLSSDMTTYIDRISTNSRELFIEEVGLLGLNIAMADENLKKELTDYYNSISSRVTKTQENLKSISKNIEQSQSYLKELVKTASESVNANFKLQNQKFNLKDFKKSYKDLQQLPFVKNVRIVGTEIRFRIDNVKITYGGKSYNMGNYTCHLAPSKIYFTGSQYVGDLYYHPHIEGTRCCLGTFLPKMYELLAMMKFKELAILLRVFLHTYTPNDKYLDLAYFTGAVRQRKKRKNKNFENDNVTPREYTNEEDNEDEEDDDYEEEETGDFCDQPQGVN